MALTVNLVGEFQVSVQGDNYTISGQMQLLDGVTVVSEKTISVSGFRYETSVANLKNSIKSKFQAEIAEWKNNTNKETALKALLAGLAAEL